MPESVPFWFAIAVVGYLGYKLARPPLWLVIVLLIAGFLLAHSVLAPAIESGTTTGVTVVTPTTQP
ncbi:hypothetical protein C8250_017255 [Streptomyces sp. So13.3]|uniref:hypothetical protein n=1 Tax=Streptomyces sp. So13.3 TaxID=2136173 RepID=UPI001106A0E2|nr:hypothetical protein [Streptomyces sp. So13.3]QNA73432.1 hypothetical protein C8250_017255 [Streptomyces sp. So13.3]